MEKIIHLAVNSPKTELTRQLQVQGKNFFQIQFKEILYRNFSRSMICCLFYLIKYSPTAALSFSLINRVQLHTCIHFDLYSCQSSPQLASNLHILAIFNSAQTRKENLRTDCHQLSLKNEKKTLATNVWCCYKIIS